ncbi:hypothetical protein [Actinoplanes couchii]|uniref:Uncharacterized protein n=1 Tax=Actinoplanes couchii TaxID=403638 RepID=A0ABQ3X630_9ACTN|nr:hypothetical protein [Actinoplanes couchii]MDR6325346.1 hypothetical protein [Actinoplanes couchii]GID53951.1 hypothetical protein Aco03nite_023550 [Actinoplanes couchii]
MTALEMRYRSLLRVYPVGHRAAYEEEMVAVLMSGAEPGRRFPAAADAVDLVRAGLSARLGRAFSSQRGTGWRDAASVAALFAALALAGAGFSRLVEGLGRMWRHGDLLEAHGVPGLLLADPAARSAIWLLVVVAALLGLRRVTSGLAVAGVLVQAGALAFWVDLAPWQSMRMIWMLVAAVLVVVLFRAASTGRPARAVLGGRGVVLVSAAALVMIGANVLSLAAPMLSSSVLTFQVPGLLLVAAALAAPSPARERIVVLGATVFAVQFVFITMWQSQMMFRTEITPALVSAVVTITLLSPVVAFALGLAGLRARERFALRRAGHVRAHE